MRAARLCWGDLDSPWKAHLSCAIRWSFPLPPLRRPRRRRQNLPPSPPPPPADAWSDVSLRKGPPRFCARRMLCPRSLFLSLTSCEGTRRGGLVSSRRRGRLRWRLEKGMWGACVVGMSRVAAEDRSPRREPWEDDAPRAGVGGRSDARAVAPPRLTPWATVYRRSAAEEKGPLSFVIGPVGEESQASGEDHGRG